MGDHVQVLGEHRVAAGDPEVDARLVDEGAVADRARDLEEALEVVDGVGEVALLLVEHAERAARLRLPLQLAARLRQAEELLQVRQTRRRIVEARVRMRERRARGALAVDVLERRAEVEVLGVVLDRLLHLLRLARRLVRLPQLEVRDPLLGGVARRDGGGEPLLVHAERLLGVGAAALELLRHRAVRDDQVLVRRLDAVGVVGRLDDPQKLLVVAEGGRAVAKRLVGDAERARRLRLALGVGRQLGDLEALLPEVDRRALVGELGEEVGEPLVRREDRLRVALPPRRLRLGEVRLDEGELARRDRRVRLRAALPTLALRPVREVEEVDERLHKPRGEDVDAEGLLVGRAGRGGGGHFGRRKARLDGQLRRRGPREQAFLRWRAAL